MIDEGEEMKASLENEKQGLMLHFKSGKQNITLLSQPYLLNTPTNIEKEMIALQIKSYVKTRKLLDQDFYKRLSMVKEVHLKDQIIIPTSSILEGSKVSKSWNVNYLSHGWHRYVGRFPPQIVRAFFNVFRIMPGDTVLDPFVGSGTTSVECKLLGINSIGIEINPLSQLIARTKVKLMANDKTIVQEWEKIKSAFYSKNGNNRDKKLIPDFPNKDRWFNKKVLYDLEKILTEVKKTPTGIQDFFYLAISAGMRSMGNVDVDVVRTEYRKIPRENVDVIRIIGRKINRYVQDIKKFKEFNTNHAKTKVIFGDVKKQKLSPESIDFIITSPPYGIESISYLRTHMLSYRVLHSVLDTEIADIRDKMIGTDYILDWSIENDELLSRTAKTFFKKIPQNSKADKNRVHQTIQYFQDMEKVFEKISICLKKNCYCVIIVGNKKLLDKIMPTHKIFSEIAAHYNLRTFKIIPTKLVCNNTTAQTPWSERMIKDENILIFKK